MGIITKPVLLGPVSYLLLGKEKNPNLIVWIWQTACCPFISSCWMNWQKLGLNGFR